MKRPTTPLTVAVIAVLSMLSLSATVWAQEEDDVGDDPRADAISVLDGQHEISRPTGWNIIGATEGAAAVFRSASDDRAQMEVRISDSVSERRWERYWRTFDTDLQEAGFSIVQPRRRESHAGQRGFYFEYELARNDDNYRLLVWHTHEGERAWVFTGFFREERRDVYLETFQELLGQMQW